MTVPHRHQVEPSLDEVLTALSDEHGREIIQALDRPKSARTLTDELDIPQTTVYRALNTLSAASLLDEQVTIRRDGHHTTRYAVNFDAVSLSLRDDQSLELTVEREADRLPSERVLASRR